MAYIIATNGNFPPQYLVLEKGEDNIYTPIFGPDPDLVDAQRKLDELSGVRARNKKGHYVADDPSTPDVNEAYVGGKAPKKKTTKKKVTKKRGRPKKSS